MRQKRGTPVHQLLLEILKKSRITAGLTQTELAETLGLPQSFISKFETGERRLDIVEFIEICKALQLEPAGVVEELANEVKPHSSKRVKRAGIIARPRANRKGPRQQRT